MPDAAAIDLIADEYFDRELFSVVGAPLSYGTVGGGYLKLALNQLLQHAFGVLVQFFLEDVPNFRLNPPQDKILGSLKSLVKEDRSHQCFEGGTEDRFALPTTTLCLASAQQQMLAKV
jgi:hypothetical protein